MIDRGEVGVFGVWGFRISIGLSTFRFRYHAKPVTMLNLDAQCDIPQNSKQLITTMGLVASRVELVEL